MLLVLHVIIKYPTVVIIAYFEIIFCRYMFTIVLLRGFYLPNLGEIYFLANLIKTFLASVDFSLRGGFSLIGGRIKSMQLLDLQQTILPKSWWSAFSFFRQYKSFEKWPSLKLFEDVMLTCIQ